MPGVYDIENHRMECGVCGKEQVAQSEAEWDAMKEQWHPYVYDGDVEVSPVCSDHQVENQDGVGRLVR